MEELYNHIGKLSVELNQVKKSLNDSFDFVKQLINIFKEEPEFKLKENADKPALPIIIAVIEKWKKDREGKNTDEKKLD